MQEIGSVASLTRHRDSPAWSHASAKLNIRTTHMVAVAVPTPTTPATSGRVSSPQNARHGRHAAAARARRAIPQEALHELRRLAHSDPRALRGRVPRWHNPTDECPGFIRAETGKEEPCPLHPETQGYAGNQRAYVGRYDPKTGRREMVREGTKSRVTWLSRDRYLQCFLPSILALAESREVLRAHNVTVDTFMRWARTESLPGYCDLDTGRHVIVRPQTVAAVMEVHQSTVNRCRSAARQLGIYATVFPGAMLGEEEQRHARWSHKSPQRGLSAESAFVIPKKFAYLGSVTCLHRGAAHGQFSAESDHCPTLNTEGGRERTPSALTKKRARRARPGYKLAKRLVERLPFARGCHPGTLAGLLHRFGAASPAWTAEDVVAHIDHVNRRRGWSAVHSPADLKAPAFALLASYLRDADPVADHPRLDVFLARERRTRTLVDNLRARDAHDRGERCGRDWCC